MTDTTEELPAELDAIVRQLADTAETDLAALADGDQLAPGRAWLRRLAPHGLAVPTWPEQLGGRGSSSEEASRIAEALRDAHCPDLYPFAIGLRIVGPALLVHGTPDQQRRWLKQIASGEEIFCQMFSEPDAGSDLANVSTVATRDGDDWVLRGQKVWTSRGSYADWGLCLARHDPSLPKHRGLTMFVIDMKAPGVVVRPLVQMDGSAHFSEVFLDDARVGDENRIAGTGDGWSVAMSVLAFERQSVQDNESSHGRPLEPDSWLRTPAVREAVRQDALIRQRAMRVFTLEQVDRLTALRARDAALSGRTPEPSGSGGKLRYARVFTERARLLKDVSGASGMLVSPADDEFLVSPSMSIRGGTDEIQRNIVAERVLGLPAEPRTDRDVPWTVSSKGLKE